MRELIKRRDSIDYIIIETSGLALPKPLIKAGKIPSRVANPEVMAEFIKKGGLK